MKTVTFTTLPPVPIDALRLQEDIRALEEARKHLKTVDPINVCEDRETGSNSLFCVEKMLRVLQRNAEKKMRTEFISPTRKKLLNVRKT